MLTTEQLFERKALGAMARAVEATTLAGVDAVIREVRSSGLFPPAGPPDEFGEHSIDLAAALAEVRRRLARDLAELVGTVGEWQQEPADPAAVTP